MSDEAKNTDTMLETLKAKHGKIGVVEVEDGAVIVFRRPTRAEYDSWMDMGGAQAGSAARRQLAEDTLVYPSRDAFYAILDEYPALLNGACTNAILELAGLGKAKTRVLKAASGSKP